MMTDVFLVVSAIALTLRSVTPVFGLPSNTRQSKSFESIWDSRLVLPNANRQQMVVPDLAHFLAAESLNSDSPNAWLKPDAEIQCGAKNMTLQIKGLGSSPLHVIQNKSWVSVFNKMPQCSRPTRHRRTIWPPYYGCGLSRQDGPATFPVRVVGTPLVVGCPFPKRSPTAECTDKLVLRLGGVSVAKLKIKVMGHWYPLMTVCRWCGVDVGLSNGEVTITAPFGGGCTEAKDGAHSISLQLGDAEIGLSCSPPTYPPYPPYPPYPQPGHTHFPWPHIPHVHPTTQRPPWPVFPLPKPVHPWQTIPHHLHTPPPMPWPAPAPPPFPIWPAPAPPPFPIWPAPAPPPFPIWPAPAPSPLPWAPVLQPAPGPVWPQATQNWLGFVKPDETQNSLKVTYVEPNAGTQGDDGQTDVTQDRYRR